VNIPRVERRLAALLNDFSWGRMDEIFLTRPTPVVATIASKDGCA
jgi:hypothetical protein